MTTAKTKIGDSAVTLMEYRAQTLYEKIDILRIVLDNLQSETAMLDFPDFDNQIRSLLDECEDWMDNKSKTEPSEDELIARELLEAM